MKLVFLQFITNKSSQEVEQYMKIFLQRYEELPQKKRIQEILKKFEDRTKFKEISKSLVNILFVKICLNKQIEQYISSFQNYLDEIDYPDYEMQKELNKNSKKFWDKKIDKYLIYWAHLYGIGNNYI